MHPLIKKRANKAGLPPGAVVYIGEHRTGEPVISVIDYDKTSVQERTIDTPEECRQYIGRSTVTWVNVSGIHNTALLKEVGEVFGLHPLVLEDIANTGQRPKLHDLGDGLFMVLKMLYRDAKSDEIVPEQVSLLLGKDYVLSFQEVEGDVFDAIRERIRTAKGRIRTMGCDYLAYALLDAIVDGYFIVIESLSDQIESVQDKVVEGANPEMLQQIHGLKRDMVFMRKNLWPLREMVGGLEKSESDLVSQVMAPYLRDVYEHTIQVIDNVELLRDMVSGALDTYMTTMSNRMNEVMKVLTVIATIFIPLTFIAGIYGMNFENMPELKWPFSYAAVWIVMIITAIGMLIFFRRRKWL